MSSAGVLALKEIFPDIPDKILEAFFAASGNNVDATVEKLLQVIQGAEQKRKREALAQPKDSRSHVVPTREYGGKCSYCNSSKTGRISYGMQANTLTVQDYQDLIDRGWRRSGNWLYVPSTTNPECCCKQYTIRLDVDKFVANKSQTKVNKKFNKFLETGAELPQEQNKDKKPKTNKNNNNDTKDKKSKDKSTEKKKPPQKQAEPAKSNPKTEQLRIALEQSVQEVKKKIPGFPEHAKFPVLINPNPSKLASRGNFSTNVSQVMAGLATSCKKDKKGKKDKNALPETVTPEQKAEAQRIRHETAMDIGKRIVQALPAEFGASIFGDGFINFKLPVQEDEQQTTASTTKPSEHAQPITTPSSSTEAPQPEVKQHKLTLNLVPAAFIKEEYELYRKYQINIHKDKPEKLTEDGYTNFLVVSPLVPQKVEGLQGGYGSFHMQYRIDNKLVAVGVVDILPSCLSSVYFFYDTDYHSLSLGVYSALTEIDWVKKVHQSVPNLHYYYMGFYIHSCPKMKYKGDYHPSDLLCALSLQWVPLEQCIPLLDKSKAFTPFVADKSAHKYLSEERVQEIIAQIPIQVQGEIVYLQQLTPAGKRIMTPNLQNYLQRVGPELALGMVYVVNN